MLLAGTPGLMTTSSIWSRSHEGTSPASSLTTPSPLSASASFDQSMNPFRSFKTTSAPRAAQKRADATPLRPAPMTRTFLPSSSIKLKRRPPSPSVKGVAREENLRRPLARVDDDVNALPPLAHQLKQLVALVNHLARRPLRPEQFEQGLARHQLQRSFSVDRLSSANSIAMMRKRKTIFGSFQPDISKWWCSGVILKSRRPVPLLLFVILKKETCSVTDRASIT